MMELPFYNAFFKTANPAAIELAARLAALVGRKMNHVFYATSGSEAVDSIIRLVRHYWALKGKPTKKYVISRQYGYHGSTLAGASAGGMVDMHNQAGDLPFFAQVMTPYWYRDGGDLSPDEFGIVAARSLEAKILELGAENVAAFIGEPIQGGGRRHHPARQLLAGNPAHLPRTRRIAGRRRGDLRLRPDRAVVRLPHL